MDQYGGATEGSSSDLQQEWIVQEPETGLDEHVWRLGLRGEESYPDRPHEANCIYYLRTGACGYGSRCRFNHPPRNAGAGSTPHEGENYPERTGQCQYYIRTGMCKFGVSCKYHHSTQGGGSASPILLNYYGYPLRPGERLCSYYAKTGSCSFGSTCKFHHPQPDGMPPRAPSLEPLVLSVPSPTIYPHMHSPSVPSSQQYGVVVAGRQPMLPSSYIHSPYGPVMISPTIVSFPNWIHYPESMSPAPPPSTQPVQSYRPMSSFGGSSRSNRKEELYPNRPGQPECQYYMRTGNCKFGFSCKYHHPPELVTPKTDVFLSSIGLPLRPGEALCTHFLQHGFCKFGPTCKFDHSMETIHGSQSGFSLPAPYSSESVVGISSLSSSSSEFHPQLNTRLRNESNSATMFSTSPNLFPRHHFF